MRMMVGAIAIVVLLTGAPAVAAPPKVIKAVPDNGATGVDSALKEVRVTFDQDMDTRSISWTGGGTTFPKLAGKIHWIGKRTCVLPVTLVPNHKYRVGINSQQHKGFRNTKGEPATPYLIAFETGVTKDPAAAAKAAVETLRVAIRDRYSYRDLGKVDWDKQFAAHEARLLAATSPQAFATVAAELLREAKDPHIWLTVGGQIVPVFQRKVTPNINMATLARTVPDWTQRSGIVWTGRFDDGVAYIQIASWATERTEALERAFEALEDFADAKGMIIDVRGNSGGSETLARHFAGCFVEKTTVYARHAYRQADGFGKVQDRTLWRKRGRPKFRGKVAVLMGPENMSSCEAFLLMMKQVPGAVLVGERSYGSSGNPKPVELGNGVTVMLPSWKAMLPDGTPLEGRGVSPDIEVKTRPADLLRCDPVLEAALKTIRKQAN